MARTWLSIRVELVSGMHADQLWPRPGRILLARPGMTFRMLANAINDGFARWDRSHLHAFSFEDGTRISLRTPWDEDDEEDLDDTKEKLSRLTLGERFAFEFDFGDSWMHLCTVGDDKVDPLEVYGEVPELPVAYFGWGSIPDQYGRRWDGDDSVSEVPPPPDPLLSDLPDLHYTWGSRAFRMPPPDAAALGAEANVIAGPWSGTSGSGGLQVPAGSSWTPEEIRDLRGAVHRRDAVAVVELVVSRSAVDVAHLAAPGLVHAAEAGHDPPRLIMVKLMDELAERGWLGDGELVDEFERVVMGVPSDLRPVLVDLDELVTLLDTPTEFDEGWRLELATGRFWPDDPMMMIGEEEPDDFDDPEAFMAVIGFASNVGYGDMRDFIATVTDERLAERLAVAIDGKGAFRRFKDTLYVEERWREAWMLFSSERWLARGRWWLADAGLRPAIERE